MDEIQIQHMKHRCYFVSVMCGMSLYNWYNYSLFDPINNNLFTPYYQNCLLMLYYLCWDTYHMTLSKRRTILFRTDLIIHHYITFVVYISTINIVPLQMSNILIMECISIMNYIWRNNPRLLNIYRILCIVLIRMPLSLWCWSYYNPAYSYPYFKNTLSYYYSLYLCKLCNIFAFFIVYDIFILYKIYTSNKVKI